MATSLSPYAAPLAADAARDIARLSDQVRTAGYRNLFLAIVVIFAAAWLKSIGMTSLVWALVIITEAYAALTVLPYLFGATPPAWVLAFVAGTAGEQNRLPEGITNANKWAKKVWRFGLWVIAYSSLALWVVALWNVEDNFHLILPLIAAGLGVTVLAVLLFGEGNFFPWTMYVIKLGILLVLLGMALPGRAGITMTRWVESAVNATIADKAEDRAKRAAETAISQQRATCYADIEEAAKGNPAKKIAPVIPTKADFERCAKIGAEATPVVAQAPMSTAAGQVNGEHQSPAPAAAPAPAAPVKTAQAESNWDCTATWKEVDYAPSEHQGKMDLGTLPAGRYAIKVAGTVWQDFYTGTPAVFDKRCEADADGRMGDCRTSDNRLILNRNGDVWPAPKPIPSASRVHIPGEAYGKVLVHAWGVPLPIGEQGQIHTGQDLPIAVDANFYQHPASYNGPGKFRVTIKQCQQT